MNVTLARQTVGVMGSGTSEHDEYARAIGEQGLHDLSRNHINVLSCAAIVALPGEHGTAAEVSLAVRYGKPVVVYTPVAALVEHFPQGVRRLERIQDVRQFLRERLDGASSTVG